MSHLHKLPAQMQPFTCSDELLHVLVLYNAILLAMTHCTRTALDTGVVGKRADSLCGSVQEAQHVQEAGGHDDDDDELYSDDDAVPVAATKPAAKPPARRQMKGATPGNQVAAGRVSKRAKK